MVKRIFNFAAGPCTLPLPALEKAASEFVEYGSSGMSLIEMSHRGKQYDAIHNAALASLREVFGVPDTHEILFLQGGATLQFGMVPMNMKVEGKTFEYVNTGAWAKKGILDAKKIGPTRVIWTDEAGKFMRMPKAAEIKAGADAAYVHVTSNETIGGIEMFEFPDTGSIPLVADMSSDILSRPLPFERFALIYAGAQKNLGPAGNTVVIIRKDVLEKCREDLPAYLGYKTHVPDKSMYNTPTVFAIYMMKLNLDWVKSVGGLKEMDKRASKRAGIIYGAIDNSGGWYRCPVDKASRSRMNVVWRLPTEELEEKFLGEAGKADFSGLKGHRSVGGCRASMYNAMPVEGAEKLAEFMAGFKKRNS
ncbi:MAG: 3-phosphoserine/phosphohydroxythreonine transaminase [Deltaproteobacteria bacterium]|nr:3-phosphoserine/phosphohydroxythreonine transaminase [Deltaproteobacteria bacterium]